MFNGIYKYFVFEIEWKLYAFYYNSSTCSDLTILHYIFITFV